MTERICKASFNPLLFFDCFYKLTKNYETEKKFRLVIDDFVQRIIKRNETKETSKLFIDRFNEISKSMTSEEISEGLAMFLGAGFETTGNTISSALLLLAMNPDIQDKVVAEARVVIESDHTDVDDEKISRLSYLDRVIKETLRLVPANLFQAM